MQRPACGDVSAGRDFAVFCGFFLGFKEIQKLRDGMIDMMFDKRADIDPRHKHGPKVQRGDATFARARRAAIEQKVKVSDVHAIGPLERFITVISRV